jgi:PiT family inorganic phosphate transporter
MLIELLLVFYVAWGIGTNEETFLKAVASRSIKLKTAITLTAIGLIIGSFFFGQIVSETLNKGITEGEKTTEFIIAVMLSMGIWFTIATILKMPISTTNSVVGAVAGAAVFYKYTINYEILRRIIISWISSPVMGVVFAFVFYRLFALLVFNKINNFESREILERYSAVILAVVSFLSVISRAANDVANAIFLFPPEQGIKILGGIGMAVGIVTAGKRVLKNIGTKLAELSPSSAIAAELSTFIVVSFFTLIGMPISSSAVSVSSIVGAGLARRKRINTRLFKEILFSWFITVPFCGFLSYGILMM